MFNCGIPNSFSEYIFFFFFLSRSAAVRPFTCLPKGVDVGFLDLDTPSEDPDLDNLLELIPDLFAACLFLIVFVLCTAIAYVYYISAVVG